MTADREIILVPQPPLHLIERAAFGGQVERTLYDVGAIHGGILVRRQTRTITQVSQCRADAAEAQKKRGVRSGPRTPLGKVL